jgi:hypothetical protein
MRNEERFQSLSIEPVNIRQPSGIHRCSMP